MNNAAGIDVSKGKSVVSVLRPFGEVVAKPFSVGHTSSELKELADCLKSLEGETRVVMEHTGRYYEPAARFLHDEGIFVSAVNPKLIKDYGNNTVRKVRTDKADARKIARYGLDNWVELRQYTPMDTSRMQLKTLNRQHGLYSKTRTMMKNNLIAPLDQTYPGVNALFDSPVREDGSLVHMIKGGSANIHDVTTTKKRLYMATVTIGGQKTREYHDPQSSGKADLLQGQPPPILE